MRSVVLASRLVHAGIATSMASQRICIDPRTLLHLPISLCLQILDCRLALVRGQLLLKALSGLIEAGIPSSFLVQPDKLGPTTVSRTKIVSLGIERSLEPI